MNQKHYPKSIKICVDVQRQDFLPEQISGYVVVSLDNFTLSNTFPYKVFHPFRDQYRTILVYRKGMLEPIVKHAAIKQEDDEEEGDFSMERIGLEGMAGLSLVCMICDAISSTMRFVGQSPFEETDMAAVSLVREYELEFESEAAVAAFEQILMG